MFSLSELGIISKERTESVLNKGAEKIALLFNPPPVLSLEIILNELDWELEKRKLKFVRYADDCIILVRSQKAAQRVMDSITKYIEAKLLLKVNRKKSKIGRPIEIKYLGFTFYNQFNAKKYKAKAHEKSVQKVVRKLKQLTSRR